MNGELFADERDVKRPTFAGQRLKRVRSDVGCRLPPGARMVGARPGDGEVETLRMDGRFEFVFEQD